MHDKRSWSNTGLATGKVRDHLYRYPYRPRPHGSCSGPEHVESDASFTNSPQCSVQERGQYQAGGQAFEGHV